MADEAAVAPGRGIVGKGGIILLLVLLSCCALLVVAALVWIWPLTAVPNAAAAATTKSCAQGSLWMIAWCPSEDQRLICIVFLGGLLGGFVHALRSTVWYVGNRRMVKSWIPWYLMLPLLGGLVSVVFFLVIRGGFFTAPAAGNASGGSAPNVFGFAAFSAMIGLYTNQALRKLQQTFESLLAIQEQGKDAITTSLGVKSAAPGRGVPGTHVAIAGTGFTSATRVKFGALAAAEARLTSDTLLTATAPQQGPGTVDIELTNPDNQNVVLHQGFTYVAEAPAVPAAAASGGAVPAVDGGAVPAAADAGAAAPVPGGASGAAAPAAGSTDPLEGALAGT
ncbi:MAG TPA: IPT/TIG domain-containing protein [Thermoanaerobaculia bacterium]|jgi:hypothetical protein|nr:IPT/TIG domain-containing protein [Thermoanaerobaculia bacterium]